jgi:hypothetical protein
VQASARACRGLSPARGPEPSHRGTLSGCPVFAPLLGGNARTLSFVSSSGLCRHDQEEAPGLRSIRVDHDCLHWKVNSGRSSAGCAAWSAKLWYQGRRDDYRPVNPRWQPQMDRQPNALIPPRLTHTSSWVPRIRYKCINLNSARGLQGRKTRFERTRATVDPDRPRVGGPRREVFPHRALRRCSRCNCRSAALTDRPSEEVQPDALEPDIRVTFQGRFGTF